MRWTCCSTAWTPSQTSLSTANTLHSWTTHSGTWSACRYRRHTNHREFRIPIKNILHPGKNTLELVFHSAIHESATRAASYPYPVPSMQGPGMLPHYNFLRKPACDFGWDWYAITMWMTILAWMNTSTRMDEYMSTMLYRSRHRGPAFAGAGVFGSVSIVGYTLPYITGTTPVIHADRASSKRCMFYVNSCTTVSAPGAVIHQRHNTTNGIVSLTVDAYIVSALEGDQKGLLSVSIPGYPKWCKSKGVTVNTVGLTKLTTKVCRQHRHVVGTSTDRNIMHAYAPRACCFPVCFPVFPCVPVLQHTHPSTHQFDIQGCKLWWPAGYGDQNLYQLTVTYEPAPWDAIVADMADMEHNASSVSRCALLDNIRRRNDEIPRAHACTIVAVGSHCCTGK